MREENPLNTTIDDEPKEIVLPFVAELSVEHRKMLGIMFRAKYGKANTDVDLKY